MTISYENQRNPILPLDIHIPDSEAHVMFDGGSIFMEALIINPGYIVVISITWSQLQI